MTSNLPARVPPPAAEILKEKPIAAFSGYRGIRTQAGCVVSRFENGVVTEVDIDWGLHVRDHSPTGLNWGYGGSGPAQCALAILLDYYKDQRYAEHGYQNFKFAYVAGIKTSQWELSLDQLEAILKQLGLPVLMR